MTEPDPPAPKWPILAGSFVAILDIVFLFVMYMYQLADQPFTPWLTGLGIQFLAGIALIANGGDGKAWGKALIYGLGYLIVVIVLIVALGLLALAVCVGLLTPLLKHSG